MNDLLQSLCGAARRLMAATACLTIALSATHVPPAGAQTTLRFATGIPLNSPIITSVYEGWVKAVNEAAQGEFVIQMMPPPFATPTNAWERTTSGVADMAHVVLANTGQPFPKSTVTVLPLIGDDTAAAGVALWRMYEQGLIADEYKDVKVINFTGIPANVLISKVPVTSMENIKGLKVRALDKNSADALAALGAVPLAVPFSEAYQALSKGVVEAAIANSQSITGFKFGEIARYQLANVAFGMNTSAIVMNKDSFAKLSPKGKAIIERFTGEQSSRVIGASHARMDAELQKEMRANKALTFTELSPSELARWRAQLERVQAEWVKQTPDGARVLSAFRSEYRAAGGK